MSVQYLSLTEYDTLEDTFNHQIIFPSSAEPHAISLAIFLGEADLYLWREMGIA